MKAFLLAAGHGTRLRPLTDHTPKCLLPVQGVPMLERWMELCRRHGVREVLINLHSQAHQVRDFLAARNSDISVQVYEEPTLLGSAGTLAANRQWVAGEPFFWVFYADVLTNVDLTAMKDFHVRRDAAVTIAVNEVPDPTRCGIVETDANGWVSSFVEKPEVPRSNLAFSGIILAGSRFLDAIPERTPSDIGFDVLPQMPGAMAAYRVREYLIDIGTMANYSSAQQNWPGFGSVEGAVSQCSRA
jgi:mannose-1-phosphate guanylyltransferase